MELLEAIHTRRSIRRYRAEPPDRALLEEIVWAAAQAPVTPVSTTRPWLFCAIEGRERLSAYGARAKQYAREHQPPGRPWSWPERPEFEVFWGAPLLVLICALRDNPETPWDCCRAGQNLMLAAHARGLGSCWLGAPMPWLRSEGVAAELGMPAGYDPVAAIVLGYADEQPLGQPKPPPGINWL